MFNKTLLLFLGCLAVAVRSDAARSLDHTEIAAIVDAVIHPLIEENDLPGMAVAVAVDGKTECFNYGVESRETGRPVTSRTLFEIGSLSKTFTVTLAAYAQVCGNLSLIEAASKYLPALQSSSFDRISLLNLATHTAGGLPLQVPEDIKDSPGLLGYLKHWQAPYAPGTHRVYSNVGIGLLGMITAEALHRPFDDAVEKQLLPALGLSHSYLHVPADQMPCYAQGYTGDDKPVRASPGVLASEAYGIKSCSSDMIRFLLENLDPAAPDSTVADENLRQALTATHTGYFTAGDLTQDLIWEQYPDPVGLERLLAGNSSEMIMHATVATPLNDPLPPQADVLINKTGSTNGFAAYVAFIPAKKLGIVLLANKRYDIKDRVTAAYKILTTLERRSAL